MYIDPEHLTIHHESYWNLVRPLVKSVPRITGLIDQISEHILSGRFYRALKLAAKLMAYEKETISHVQ